MDQPTVEFLSHSPEQTRRIGTRLGAVLRPGDVICLQGDLGAGKTTFVQGIAEGWGSLDSVSSPTFILVNVYRSADERQLFHLDAYRLDSVLEAEELDLTDMLAQGPLLVEWPERLESLVPPDRLWINLIYIDQEEREMRVKSHGRRYEVLREAVRQAIEAED